MEEACTLTIRSSSDTIILRARVRELARQRGLDLTSQARISLAVYSLATVLRMGSEHAGQVVVDRLSEGKQVGIRVACIVADAAEVDPTPNVLGDVGWMVDELAIETLPSNAVKVTLVQWTTPRSSGIFSGRERPFSVI